MSDISLADDRFKDASLIIRLFADYLSDLAKEFHKDIYLNQLLEKQVIELHQVGRAVKDAEDVREASKNS